MKQILVVDQGTTNSRAILFDSAGNLLNAHQEELPCLFPQPGWVEQEPSKIWSTVENCCSKLLQQTTLEDVAGIGISNQRETTIIWERESGKPVYNAIVWQDRRTYDFCLELKNKNFEKIIQEKTGLLLDPYFSATKIHWILSTIPHGFERAAGGELLFGTIDCYLLWCLTRGKVHATDITNAARTLLFNIQTLDWDDQLLDIFSIPKIMLPAVKSNSEWLGWSDKAVFNRELPIVAMMGDQQAAMIGEGCLTIGSAKCTFGTGCFLMINTGSSEAYHADKLLKTVAAYLNGSLTYAIEGSVYAAGTIIKWLKDTLKIIHSPEESEQLAKAMPNNSGVYLVPAFTGLGAPYWDPTAKGAIYGLTRDTGPAQLVRAGLEAIAYQTKDLLLTADYSVKDLRVDGGVTVNEWLMQFLADILQLPIVISGVKEATALGICYLAAYNLGLISNLDELHRHQKLETTYYPKMDPLQAQDLYQGWQEAVARTLSPHPTPYASS
jgi:glycerol kinase